MKSKPGVRLACGLWLSAASAAGAATFEGVGFLGNGTSSKAWAVSADGSVVVGEAATSGTGAIEAFRWTTGGGIESLGLFTGGQRPLVAFGLSEDGSVIGGRSAITPSGSVGFRWTQATGITNVGDLAGGSSPAARVFDLTDDGSMMVGGSSNGAEVPAIWTTNMPTAVTMAVGALGGHFVGVSADGAFLAGSLNVGNQRAYRWTAATQAWLALPFLTGGATSNAWDISADGMVIVGEGNSSLGGQAFRWTPGGGTVGLGDLPGGDFQSVARATTADGGVVVGWSMAATGRDAFIWDPVNQMRSLTTVLTDLGVDLTGWALGDAMGISADGNVITGWGTNPQGRQEGWVAVLSNNEPPQITPEPGSVAILAAASIVLLTRRNSRRSTTAG